jgi:hypothetical protein
MKKFRAGKFLMKLFTKEFFKTEKASQYNDGEGLSKGFTRDEWVIITTWMVKYQKDKDWASVDDKLPKLTHEHSWGKYSDYVLANYKGSVVCVKYGYQERLPSTSFVKEYDFYWRDSKGYEYNNGITDWQPQPQLPNVKN